MSVLDDIQRQFKSGNIIMKVLIVNIGIFILVNIIDLFFFLGNMHTESFAYSWLSFPSNPVEFIHRPWSVITYMFTQEGFFHILFNMLWWYWLGQIFLLFFSQRQLFGLYMLGGIGGAMLYMLAFNTLPVFQSAAIGSAAIGASAAVLAIVVAIGAYSPNYRLNLMFLGPVQMKYIALVVVVLDVLNLKSANAGGHIAHLGGALVGYLYAIQFKKGKDITSGINNIIDKIAVLLPGKKRSRMHVAYKNPNARRNKGKAKKNTTPRSDIEYKKSKNAQQEELDRILDKISKSGYDALTKAEKDLLFKISKDKE